MATTTKTEKGIQKNLVMYIGDDKSYWNKIQATLKEYNIPFKYKIIPSDVGDDTRRVFLEIMKTQPVIIYIDFSHNLQSKYKLVQIIRRDNNTKSMATVGLVDTWDILHQCTLSGVHFTHVKCGELYSIGYDPCVMVYSNKIRPPGFVTTQPNDKATLITDFKIGYITSSYIHCEGNLELKIDDIIELKCGVPKGIVPSKRYSVKKIRQHNLYFDFTYNYDLNFTYVDKTEPDEEDDQKTIDKKTKEYERNLIQSKEGITGWLRRKNRDSKDSMEKKTKILIYDIEMRILKDGDKPLDQYPFVIRTQTTFSEDLNEIHRIRPDLIAFQLVLNNEKKESKSDEKDNVLVFEKEQISKLIETIQSIKGFNPFIILFGCKQFNSESFQDSFQYAQAMTNSEDMNLKILFKMAKLLEMKRKEAKEKIINEAIEQLKLTDKKKYLHIKKKMGNERLYVGKMSDLSHASHGLPVVIEKISETEMTFTANIILDLGNYRMEFPTNMHIRLLPIDNKPFQKEGKAYRYWGLIHCTGEDEKKQLRQYINETVMRLTGRGKKSKSA